MTGSDRSSGWVIDADGHAVEDHAAFCALLPPALRQLAPQFAPAPSGAARLVSLEGRPWVPVFEFVLTDSLRSRQRRIGEAATDALARVRVLDEEEIDISIIFPSLGLYFGLYSDPQVAAAMCRAENRWLGTWCRAAPARLAPVAVLPQQDPELAASELEMAVERDGAVGGMVRPNPSAGRRVDADDFDVLWRTAADLDVPVVFHEGWVGGGCPTVGADRARSYAAAHAMSHPFEAMSAMLAVAQSGVLTRFPTLRLGFFEAGCGWAPWWEGRIADHAALRPQEFADPAPLLSQRVWLTCEPGEEGLASVAASPWGANVCFASDFPHLDAAFPGAVRLVRERGLTPESLRRVLGGNALALFGPRLSARLSAGAVPPVTVSMPSRDTERDKRIFLRSRGCDEVSHSGGSLLDHLTATAGVLRAWSARAALRDAGLFHSVYGTEAFDAEVASVDDRSPVRELIGAEAEELVWLFSSSCQDSIVEAARSGAPVVDRRGLPLALTASQLRDLAELAAANWFEQSPRIPFEARGQLLDAACRLRPFLSAGARSALALAQDVQADEASFQRWVQHSQRVVTLTLGGVPAPLPTFEPERVLSDVVALEMLRGVACRLRDDGWDNTRSGLFGELALRVPVLADRLRAELGNGMEALIRTGLLECADPESNRVTLAVGLMALGREIVVVPGDGRRHDGVYFGFEPLLLEQLRRAVAPQACQVLECGAGAGLASLLAARGAKVLATDVLHRASASVALTRALNLHLAERLSVLTADGGKSLRPGVFDVVLANPPHVPTPEGTAKARYAAGGPTGTELPVRMLHEAVTLLAHGGVLAMLALDCTLADGRRPIDEALSGLGERYMVVRLLSPWRFLIPGATEELVARHHHALVDARHVGLLVLRADGKGASAVEERRDLAVAQLAGLGWSLLEAGRP